MHSGCMVYIALSPQGWRPCAHVISIDIFLYRIHNYTDPLSSGQRKRSLPSDKEVETLSKRPKEDVTVQGMI